MLDMSAVLLQGTRIDQDVVQVDNNKLTQEVTENIINEILKDRRSVGKAKGHD